MSSLDCPGDEIENEGSLKIELEPKLATLSPSPSHGVRHNASSIPVSDLALALLLGDARVGEVLAGCQIEDCEECNTHNIIWWDCCNALNKSTRISLQAWLNAEGWGLPDAPWEDADEHGNVAPRNNVGPRT